MTGHPLALSQRGPSSNPPSLRQGGRGDTHVPSELLCTTEQIQLPAPLSLSHSQDLLPPPTAFPVQEQLCGRLCSRHTVSNQPTS